MAIDKDLLEVVLDAVRPSLQADGGDCALVGVDDETGVVTIEMTGACAGCSLSEVTISQGQRPRRHRREGGDVGGPLRP